MKKPKKIRLQCSGRKQKEQFAADLARVAKRFDLEDWAKPPRHW